MITSWCFISALRSADRPIELRAVVKVADRIDRDAIVLDAPHAGDVEVLERQAERIDHLVARRARRILAVLFHALAHRQRLAGVNGLGFFERRHVGRRRRRRRAKQHFHDPLAAQHRRGAIGDRRQQQHAALAEHAAAIRVGDRDAAEVVAEDVGNAVVLGEPLVHEGVIGGEQIGDRPIFTNQAVDEQLGLTHHGLRQRGVPIPIEVMIGTDLLDVLQAQPLRREARRQRLRSRVGDHALQLLLEHRRRCATSRSRPPSTVPRRASSPTGRTTAATPDPDR